MLARHLWPQSISYCLFSCHRLQPLRLRCFLTPIPAESWSLASQRRFGPSFGGACWAGRCCFWSFACSRSLRSRDSCCGFYWSQHRCLERRLLTRRSLCYLELNHFGSKVSSLSTWYSYQYLPQYQRSGTWHWPGQPLLLLHDQIKIRYLVQK